MSRQLDVSAIRARLTASGGKKFWRSLDELANTEEFQELVEREFPRQAGELRDPVTRRSFLKLMGASLALGGLSGCQFAIRQPQEKVLPYVSVPEGVVAGKPLFFATAMPFGGYGMGLLVESHEGRPTKIEGNPNHPDSLGSTNLFAQASVLTMYDPDRSQSIMSGGKTSDWNTFTSAVSQAISQQGAGLRILSGTVTSPTLISQIQELLGRYSGAKWYQYEPAGRDNAQTGGQQAFGSPVDTVYRLDAAEVVLAVDADSLLAGTGNVRYSRDLFNKRRVVGEQPTMNRLYAIESTPSLTGTLADHRIAVRPSQVETLLRTIAQALGVQGVAAPTGTLEGSAPAWAAAVAKDLQSKGGASVVVVGNEQPPIVHAIGHAINQTLGSVGTTVTYIDPVAAQSGDGTTGIAGLKALVGEMTGGQVSVLVMLETNPVFTAPADIAFADALAKVPLSVHYGLYDDETAEKSTWHINATHYLEAWSDVRAFDGTASIIQPLIAPLYGGKTAHEVVAALGGQATAKSYDLVRAYWQTQQTGGAFEQFWQKSVQDGVVANTTAQPKQVTLASGFDAGATAAPTDGIEVVFRPDPTIWDGSYANNGWLQELPKPLTKLTWDNAVHLSPATAERLGVTNGDLVKIDYAGRTAQGPVWIQPGHVNETATIHFGYGRTRVGRVGKGTGFNAYALRDSDAPWSGSGLGLQKAGGTYQLASTQDGSGIQGGVNDGSTMHGRDIIRIGTLAEFAANRSFFDQKYDLEHAHAAEGEAASGEGHAEEGKKEVISLYPKYDYSKGYAWGMAIDLNVCTGCNACVVACQSENNIPVVGKDQVARGREMHWLRIDRYYEGDLENADAYHMPMACQQCENAPCEPVCPVGATVHDAEGLNNMVYNRCVGTKYCSNNCPFKVRRFNFYQYNDETTPSLKLQRNPEVTVRSRGVMEKCTFCVQRINNARIEAEKANTTIPDGGVVTACQQACPTQAIVFGNINDPNSAVAKLKKEITSYTLLNNLNVNARTSYMPRIRNTNPELETRE